MSNFQNGYFRTPLVWLTWLTRLSTLSRIVLLFSTVSSKFCSHSSSDFNFFVSDSTFIHLKEGNSPRSHQNLLSDISRMIQTFLSSSSELSNSNKFMLILKTSQSNNNKSNQLAHFSSIQFKRRWDVRGFKNTRTTKYRKRRKYWDQMTLHRIDSKYMKERKNGEKH